MSLNIDQIFIKKNRVKNMVKSENVFKKSKRCPEITCYLSFGMGIFFTPIFTPKMFFT